MRNILKYAAIYKKDPDTPAYSVYVPDFDIYTNGDDINDAVFMAKDAISLMCVDMIEDNKELPESTPIDKIKTKSNEEKVLVDIDIASFKEELDRINNRPTRTNVTIPYKLKMQAEEQKINFSATLTEALREKLHIKTK